MQILHGFRQKLHEAMCDWRCACEVYVAHLRSNKREKAANDAQARFANYVLDNERFASTGPIARRQRWRRLRRLEQFFTKTY